MTDSKKRGRPQEASPPSVSPAPEPEPASGAVLELPEAAVSRLEEELAALKDRHLRVAAEYDNFRKRTVRERTDLWSKAQIELIVRLIDALDDLARFAHVDPAQTEAKTLHDGIEMVERKLWKELETVGITRIDQVGVPFDPKVHEAVTTAPAAAPEQDHSVGTVFQAGYRLNDVLIRPARVQVLTWSDAAGGGES